MVLFFGVLAGFAIQGMLSVNYPRLGAALGFVVTTGVLVYGWTLYQKGIHLTLVNYPVSRTQFLAGCAAWYAWDALQLAARKRR